MEKIISKKEAVQDLLRKFSRSDDDEIFIRSFCEYIYQHGVLDGLKMVDKTFAGGTD